ncbi:MAG: glycosyltransferase [Alistipes sp.]|nr:glycosyltransferase [Alistipes sp.]
MKLSIITINYNNRDGLRKTIESVVNQTWQDFEYIIIDGGSTDGSVEVIKEFADHIDYWISEPDKGIYDAMNKGIDQAKGEYCLFMNSADTIYETTTLENVHQQLDGTDIISGSLLFEHGYHMIPPQKVTAKFFFTSTLPHQATFIWRNLFDIQKYDRSYRIVSDWKFWIEMLIQNNKSYKTIPVVIALFDNSGISSTNEDLRIQEQQQVLKSIFQPRVLSDYHTLLRGDTYEEKLYLVIKAHKFNKAFYTLNIVIFKLFSLFSKRTAQWVKAFPFKI